MARWEIPEPNGGFTYSIFISTYIYIHIFHVNITLDLMKVFPLSVMFDFLISRWYSGRMNGIPSSKPTMRNWPSDLPFQHGDLRGCVNYKR